MAVIEDFPSSPLREASLLRTSQFLGNLNGPLTVVCNEKTRGNGYKLKYRKYHLNTRNRSCPERLWSPHPWWYPTPDWTQPWATALLEPVLSREVVLDHPQRFLPDATTVILWSVNYRGRILRQVNCQSSKLKDSMELHFFREPTNRYYQLSCQAK